MHKFIGCLIFDLGVVGGVAGFVAVVDLDMTADEGIIPLLDIMTTLEDDISIASFILDLGVVAGIDGLNADVDEDITGEEGAIPAVLFDKIMTLEDGIFMKDCSWLTVIIKDLVDGVAWFLLLEEYARREEVGAIVDNILEVVIAGFKVGNAKKKKNFIGA